MKRRILSLLLVLTLLLALPFAAAADETKEVTLTLTKDTWTYTDTVTFSVKGPDDEDVPNGEVEVRSSMDHVFCHVNNGVAEISASVLISKLELTLGQKTEISVNYIPGSGSDYGPKSGQTSITVNESTLPTVALTSAGYAYGRPVSGFQLTTPTGVQIGGKQIHDETDAEVTDGTFGAQAYTLWVNLECEEGYKLSEKPAVTLDGKEPLRIEDGFYVFQLDRLVTTYHIKYTLDGGTMSGAPETYTENSADITLPQPTKADYRFTGWTGTDLTAPTMEVTIPTGSKGDREYTANWEKIQYFTVSYRDGGHGKSTMPADEKVEEGKYATRPTDPTEKGWIFKGWYEKDDYIGDVFDFEKTQITHDITLTARWAQAFTVKFDANGHGAAPADQTVEINGKAAKPTDPTDGDYSFQGWYTTAECSTTFDFSTPITGDTTVYAKWVKKPIVSFNANGHGTAPARQTVELNGKATKPADPTAEGYVFRGWYTTAACTTEFDFNTPIAADTTLYAKWDEIYTVTFNVGGHGTAPTPQKVENGGKATKPENPTAKGWRFDGWYTDEKCTAGYDFDKAVTANTTLYAKWTQLFTLTFETNGGTKIDSVEAPDGSLVYLGSYKPTKSGYYFVGWYTDKNLTRASRVGYVRMDGNKTVYAKFAVADKTNPKTADPALPGLALAVLSFSTVGLAALGIQKRK